MLNSSIPDPTLHQDTHTIFQSTVYLLNLTREVKVDFEKNEYLFICNWNFYLIGQIQQVVEHLLNNVLNIGNTLSSIILEIILMVLL